MYGMSKLLTCTQTHLDTSIPLYNTNYSMYMHVICMYVCLFICMYSIRICVNVCI